MNITLFNGVLSTQGFTTAANGVSTGVIQTLGGISANAQSWFNGILTTYLTANSITTTSLNATSITTTSLYASNAFVRAPVIRISQETTLTASQFGVNQYIIFDNNRNQAKYTVGFPHPRKLNGQIIRIWNNTNGLQILVLSFNGIFVNTASTTNSREGLIVNSGVSFIIHSDGLEWGVFNG